MVGLKSKLISESVRISSETERVGVLKTKLTSESVLVGTWKELYPVVDFWRTLQLIPIGGHLGWIEGRNECEFNCHSCDICGIWFDDDCNKLPKEVLQKLGKVKGLFWKCEECLDIKVKNSKLKQSFEKITNEIQKVTLAIQNNLAYVKLSIQQNSDQILIIKKETSDIKDLTSLKQSIRTGNDFSSIERDISVLRKNTTKQSSLSTTIINATTQTKLKQTLGLLERN